MTVRCRLHNDNEPECWTGSLVGARPVDEPYGIVIPADRGCALAQAGGWQIVDAAHITDLRDRP